MPPLLKQWYDLVLEHGFAYGERGVALKGKPWLCAITVGAPAEAYTLEGRHRFPLRQLLSPIEATANLCQMPFIAPYVLYGSLGADEETRRAHAAGYQHLLEAIRDGRLDLGAMRGQDTISAADIAQIVPGA
jgi:putative NADPH-quinone reductase